MMRVFLRSAVGWAVLASLTCAGVPSAYAANVADAKVTLAKLSYKVTEMDASDGLAAAITFQPKQWDGTQRSIFDAEPSGLVSQTNQVNEVVLGSVLDSGNKVVSLGRMPLARASKTGTTLMAQSGFTAAEAKTILKGPYEPTSSLGESYLGLSRSANVGVSGSLGALSDWLSNSRHTVR